MFSRLEFVAISGPTYDPLPPFTWSTADFEAECPHFGHPDVFKFDPVTFNGTFNSDKIKMSANRVHDINVSVY